MDSSTTQLPERFPLFWGSVVLRFLVATTYITLFFWAHGRYYSDLANGFILSDYGNIANWALKAFVIAGVPSLVVAVGLLCRKRLFAWLAVIHDVLLAYIAAVITVRASLYSDDLQQGMVIIPMLLLFYEGFCLAFELKTARVVPIFVILSLGLFTAGFLTFNLPRRAMIARAQPLVTYVDRHWLAMPNDLLNFECNIGTDKRSGLTTFVFNRLRSPAHRLDEASPYQINDILLMAEDLGSGRWRIPGNATSAGKKVPVVIVGGFIMLPDRTLFSSKSRARSVLKAMRSGEHLSYTGIADDCSVISTQSQWHWTLRDEDGNIEEFICPKSGTNYYVSTDPAGGYAVLIRPRQTIDIPEAR